MVHSYPCKTKDPGPPEGPGYPVLTMTNATLVPEPVATRSRAAGGALPKEKRDGRFNSNHPESLECQ
jgi:hypothetical protein